ncbi:TRP domain-containing protein [Mycena indigotica]|uniref:TRP domain-containing protein n=1 Tax=Mycena indigotica TaxID=2126181 RepID=A0A8H6SPC4_9AGAR|nr:TRP domain-containing protein [Mycena indigotica]KAF7302291.1 TRP domain-containing protein [Mycena indigotica]
MGRLCRPRMVAATLLCSLFALPTFADPATLDFEDCFSGNSSVKLAVDHVYGQVLDSPSANMGTYLNLTLVGTSPQAIQGFTDSSSSLATLFTTTTVLTLNVWTNSSYLCRTIRPQSPLPPLENATDYCPVAAGPFALSASIPWGTNRPLTTLNTRLRAVDPFSSELLCISVNTTPLSPSNDSPYGIAHAIFWSTVGLAMLYWLVIGIARIVSAWGRGITRPGRSLWAHGQSAGFILASAISGERFATSPALMRFSTPCLRDVLFHTQWCASLAMVAVQWPAFIYPILAQTSWATLTYNVTLTDRQHWNPLSTLPYNPPSTFTDQLADSSSPLYINPSVPNLLFTLPSDAASGIAMFAYTVGVRPQALFEICIILFLGIVAATIVLSAIVWFIDFLGSFVSGALSHSPGIRARSPGPRDLENAASNEDKAAMFRPASRLTLSGGGMGIATPRKPWYRVRTEISSFHWSVLHGNLVRILVIFHLPLTIFAVYEMTQPASLASVRARALAGLSFAILSILVPVILVVRVTLTTTNKLYDETRTLLALGPLYNHYRHGSQLFASLLFATNLVFGIVIGAGQKSGTAQAIVILIVEVAAALVTSIWLPWGTGASMGLISFLFCVARIVVAVLLVILTPAISIGDGAAAWVAYGVLVILALVYLALALMLVIKLVEAAIRIVGQVGFDKSTHVVDSGLLGACGLLGCCGSRKRRVPKHRTRQRRTYAAAQVSDGGSSTFVPPPLLSGDSASKKSIHSQPPSVLRPEHALRPYREDSDDESGYIMGAWQPFPRPGYNQVEKSSAPPPSSGFSRVGGGRAHIDAPYAITPGAPAPATPPNGSSSSLAWPAVEDTPSMASVPRRQSPETVMTGSGLPRGAMQPHMRTKSQTAIIENAPMLASSSRPPSRPQHPSEELEDDSDSDGQVEVGQRKKKPWYHIRRHRPQSEGVPPSAFPAQTAEQAALATGDTPPGRSFVVIRKGQASPARSQQLSTASTPTRAMFRTESAGEIRNSSATS